MTHRYRFMTLTYIYHSGFLLRTPQCSVIFDFWKDPETAVPRFLDDIDADKPVYVLISHHHKDHYNPEVFQWVKRFKKLKYILSKDTCRAARHFITPGSLYKGSLRVDPDKVVSISPEETWHDDIIHIDAFGSTDIGCSYLVTLGDKRIFHAGDLNAWIWKDESSQGEVDEALAAFDKILASIASKTSEIDIAMFPVDPRLGTDFYEGAKIFVHKFKVNHFFPMHFTLVEGDTSQFDYIAAASRFSKYANLDHGEYITLAASGASWHTVADTNNPSK